MQDNTLGDFLDHEVVPRLSIEQVFTDPAHAWKEKGKKNWKGSCPWHESKTGTSFTVNPETLQWWCAGGCGGGGPMQYLWRKKGGTGTPHGEDFKEILRELAALAGVQVPERRLSEEERETLRKREGRRTALAVVIDHAHEVLLSDVGAEARTYLHGRGFTDENIEDLRLGLYYSREDVRKALQKAGVAEDEVEDAALLWSKLEGYIIVPWMDERGHPLTLYGRWVGPPPEGKPKTIALPGEGTKSSPLYFDRARAAGLKELVLVEGVFDAALLQVRGDASVVASVAARLSDLQVETLARNRVRTVFVCGDPDGGGDKGNAANVEALTETGIQSYVVRRLPDGMDPDEYVLEHGLSAWKDLVSDSTPGPVFVGRSLLGAVSPTSPDHERRTAVEAVSAYAATLPEGSALDKDDLLKLVAERTGYLLPTIAEVVIEAGLRRDTEARKRDVTERLRKAQALVSEGKDLEVALVLREALDATRARCVDTPPTFSVDRLEQESRNAPAGRPSGWAVLDRLEVSFNPGELAVLGARTGHCKTSALVGLMVNWAKTVKGDEVLVLYSQEEPEVRIYHRLLALLALDSGSGWTGAEVRDFLRDRYSRGPSYGWPSSTSPEKAREALREWEDRLLVVSRPAWTVEDLEDHAHELASHHTVGAVLVDYLQRVPAPAGGRYDRRDIEVSAVARRLKALAVDLAVPVVVGCQVNRESIPQDYRKRLEGKTYEEAKKVIRTARPELSHLREGGAEQEADLVLGLLNYAGDYRTDADGGAEHRVPDVTRLEVGTLKNRYGVPGRWAALAYEGRFNYIRDPFTPEEV